MADPRFNSIHLEGVRREDFRQALHRFGNKAVGLFDGPTRFVDKPGLNTVPLPAKFARFLRREERRRRVRRARRPG